MTYVHRFSSHPELEFEALEPHFMRAYIAHVRHGLPLTPTLTPTLTPHPNPSP